jgi:hypothetical protein
MKKIITPIAYTIVILALLSFYGWMVKHITLGDKDFGALNKPIKEMVGFLDLFKESVEEVKKLPETFVKTPDPYPFKNELEEDVIILSTYSNSDNGRTIELRNLRTDEVLYEWVLTRPFQEHDRIMDPLLLPNKEIVYSINGVTGFFKIDSTGKEVWKQTDIAHHHSMNLDADGNIWACSYSKENGNFIIYGANYKLDGRKFNFIDNTFSQLDPATGEILFHKSMAELIAENNLSYLLVQSANTEDPIHLNDVQPALKSSKYYKKGDVFLSMRNISTVFHYRPSNDSLIEVIQGPFATQHDVDYINDSIICFFNNNSHTLWQWSPSQWKTVEEPLNTGEFASGITFYNLATKEFSAPYDSIFKANQIFTHTEGMQEHLGNGYYFVEEQNSGFIYVLNQNKVIYQSVLKSHHEGYHHLTNWIRIIK